MFCSHCGYSVAPEWTSCPKCGNALSAVPGSAQTISPVPSTEPAKFAQQVHLLAVLYFVSGAILMIPAIVMAVLAGVITLPMAEGDVPRIAILSGSGLFTILCAFFVAGAALRFIAGWGLLQRRPWGRTFALVMSFIELIHPPLGTLLGVYGLFVLMPATAGAEYERIMVPV